MPEKVALLIGVSEYGEDLESLSAPINDVVEMKRVLENPSMGEFDRVETLINPDLIPMRVAIQKIFSSLSKDDLVLLFFSGHGVTDDDNRLYLATKGTSKEYYQATSVSANFIQNVSQESYAKRQVIILDCCYSGAFAEGWKPKSIDLALKKELGAKGRVVLTSSTATQRSFQQEGEKLSLYTKYFVEGIETGAADQNRSGTISAQELHEYAKIKVQEAKPKQKPDIITDKEGYNIVLSKAPVDEPELDFRKFVEKYANEGHITPAGNRILQVKRQEFGITEEKSNEIINEVLDPYRKRIENIAIYNQAFIEAIEEAYPLTERMLTELQELQDILGLEDKDIKQIIERILSEKREKHNLQEKTQLEEQVASQQNELEKKYSGSNTLDRKTEHTAQKDSIIEELEGTISEQSNSINSTQSQNKRNLKVISGIIVLVSGVGITANLLIPNITNNNFPQSLENKNAVQPPTTIDEVIDYLPDTNPQNVSVTNVNQMRDVSPTDWYYEALRSLVDRYGIVNPYKDMTFRGEQPMTKAELIALEAESFLQLYRLYKASIEALKDENFSCKTNEAPLLNSFILPQDVSSNDWYYNSYKAIAWITDNDYLISKGLFNGEQAVSRGEMVVFINKYINGLENIISRRSKISNLTSQELSKIDNNKKINSSQNNMQAQVTNVNQLRDVKSTDYYYEDLKGLVNRIGSLSGFPNQTFKANQSASRGEVAALLNSSLNQVERIIASIEEVNCF